MASLSPALLLFIPALYVTVTSFSFVSGLKYISGQALLCYALAFKRTILPWPETRQDIQHTRKPAAAYMHTLVFRLSHRCSAQNCPLSLVDPSRFLIHGAAARGPTHGVVVPKYTSFSQGDHGLPYGGNYGFLQKSHG